MAPYGAVPILKLAMIGSLSVALSRPVPEGLPEKHGLLSLAAAVCSCSLCFHLLQFTSCFHNKIKYLELVVVFLFMFLKNELEHVSWIFLELIYPAFLLMTCVNLPPNARNLQYV